MAKGYKGESCWQAIKDSVAEGEVVGYNELFKRVQAKGNWTVSNIDQNLICSVVNLPPARRHWQGSIGTLFLRPDGQYELFDKAKHPATVE